MPEIKVDDRVIELTIYCSKCGKGLCNFTTLRESRYINDQFELYVEPCPDCLSKLQIENEALILKLEKLEKKVAEYENE